MAAAALAMASAAGLAHAAPADLFSQHDDFTPHTNQIGPPPPHRTLQWNNRTGRWGVNLDMAQPKDQTPDGRKLTNQGPAPRVRLETTFKF